MIVTLKIGDQVIARTKAGAVVAGRVLTINDGKRTVQVSPEVQGAIWVPVEQCLTPATAFAVLDEEKPDPTATKEAETQTSAPAPS